MAETLVLQGALANVFGKNSMDIVGMINHGLTNPRILSSKTNEQHVTYKLAPSFGAGLKPSFKLMDDNLKVMIAGTVKKLEAEKDLSWENVLAMMQQNVLLEPDESVPPIYKADHYERNSIDYFKVDGSADQGTVLAIEQWFKNLIGDEDVLKTTAVNIKQLANIVAETGVHVSSPEHIFAANEYVEKTVIDVGIIRFPDIDNPFFKIYRIQVKAWRSSKRILCIEENRNGITCDFNSRRYKPRLSVLNSMKEETKKRAIQEVDDLFPAKTA